MTFDPALPTDRDWVRFRVGDVVPTLEVFPDATYDTILADAGERHEAAAQMCEAIFAKVVRDPTAFTAVGQMAVQWANRDKMMEIAASLRAYAPIPLDRRVIETQPMRYPDDPYKYLPDTSRSTHQ